MAESFTRLLIDLIDQLPPEVRPQVGFLFGQAAAHYHVTGTLLATMLVVAVLGIAFGLRWAFR